MKCGVGEPVSVLKIEARRGGKANAPIDSWIILALMLAPDPDTDTFEIQQTHL